MISNDIHVKKTDTIVEAINFVDKFIDKMVKFLIDNPTYNYNAVIKKKKDEWEIQLQFWNGTNSFKPTKGSAKLNDIL